MSRGYAFVYALAYPLVRLLFPVKILGRENIPEGAAVVCAPHSSFLDPLLVAIAYGRRRQLHFMAKAELFKIPVLSWFIRLAGAFPVHRGQRDVTSIRTAMRYLRNGERIMMFPEGTRVQEDDKVAAKTGAVRLAEKMKVPVTPVYVPRKKRLFGRHHVVIGESYMIPKTADADYHKLADELMAKIGALREMAE